MGFGIRVTFFPTLRPRANGGVDVPGASVGLEVFGQNPPAKRFSAKGATLVFFGAYLENARGVSSPTFKRLATLQGQIELKGSPAKPVFILEPDAELLHVDPEPGKGEPFRELRLSYATGSVRGAPADPSNATRLRLPKAPPKARFFELAVELKIAGSLEASVDQNQRLDVPLRFPIGDQLFWVTEPPQDPAIKPELVVFDEDGNEQERIPLDSATSGAGTTQTIDLSSIRGGRARLLELHRGQSPLLPVMRLEVDELRERLASGIAAGIAEALRANKTGEPPEALDDDDLPEISAPDQDPDLPPLLPSGGAI